MVYYQRGDLEGFVLALYDASLTCAKSGISDSEFVIGLVSKFAPTKGQDHLVEAAKSLREVGIINVRYMLIRGTVTGHESYFHNIQRKINEYRLEGDFIFTGIRTDVARLINACGVMVHVPIHHDPFPGVVLEAMAMGKPVIGTRSGGIPEQFEDGVSSIIIPRRDSDRLTEAIISLYKDEDKRNGLRKAAREYLTTHFSLEKHLEAVERVYAQLLESNR